MEKIKANFKFISSLLFIFSLVNGLIFLELKIIEPENIILLVILSFLITLYLYFLEKFTKWGYYLNGDGVSFYEGGNVVLARWNEIEVKKLVLFRFVITSNTDKIGHIPLKYFYEKSLIELISKYCPKEHALYKEIDSYTQKNKKPY